MRVALIGTRGVPARYGGFETCVEEVGARLVEAGHQVLVYCRPSETGAGHEREYRGMIRVTLPIVRKRSMETLAHTTLSVLHRSLGGADAALVFNAANGPLLPVIRARRVPVATHVDGLEWQRGKWGATGRRYYRLAESLSVRWSDALIADAQGIADYYRAEFGADTEQIAYGAPATVRDDGTRIAALGLRSGEYHLVVARFEPENHVLEAVSGYVRSRARFPLVVVGSAPYADAYTATVSEAADVRVRLLGGIWDQELLDQLYAHALTYLHGHSVGGTNPSLLRATGAGAYTLAFDIAFNHEVIKGLGGYWNTPESLAALIEAAETEPARIQAVGQELQRQIIQRYSWDDVAAKYEHLCKRLVAGEFAGRRPSGLRRPA